MSDHSALSLTLSVEKDSYIAGETVFAKLELRNIGTESVLVNRRMALDSPFAPSRFREVTFGVSGPTGESLDFALLVNRGAPKEDDFWYWGRPKQSNTATNSAGHIPSTSQVSILFKLPTRTRAIRAPGDWPGRARSSRIWQGLL